MSYIKSQMVYDDYKWTARAGHDNPRFIGNQESTMLNRSEGYEMLWFINSLAKTWGKEGDLNFYQKLERILREKVPSSTRTHSAIKEWIESNYQI